MKKFTNVRDSFDNVKRSANVNIRLWAATSISKNETTEGRRTEDTMQVDNEKPLDAGGNNGTRTKENDDFKKPVKIMKKQP